MLSRVALRTLADCKSAIQQDAILRYRVEKYVQHPFSDGFNSSADRATPPRAGNAQLPSRHALPESAPRYPCPLLESRKTRARAPRPPRCRDKTDARQAKTLSRPQTPHGARWLGWRRASAPPANAARRPARIVARTSRRPRTPRGNNSPPARNRSDATSARATR